MGLFKFCDALTKSLFGNEGKGVWDYYRESSVPLPDGGDTHIHPHEDGEGATVTTRLPGGFTDHVSIREPETFSRDDRGDLTGFRAVFGDDNRTSEDLTGFRSVFGDDNES